MLGILLLYICFTASMFVEGSIVASNHYPLFITGMRICIGGLVLLLLYLLQGGAIPVKELKKIGNISFLKNVVSLYVISPFLGSWSMQYLDPVKACFIFVMLPFITAIMLYFWYGERLTRYKLYGLMLGFIAIIPIIFGSNNKHMQVELGYLTAFAYLGFACSVISFAYGWIMYKKATGESELKTELVTSISLIIGGLINLSIVGITQRDQLYSMQLTDNFWKMLLLFSLLTAVGYYLYSVLLKYYTATFMSFSSFLEPAFALIYSWIFLRHAFSILPCIALGILSVGFYLFYKEELRLA